MAPVKHKKSKSKTPTAKSHPAHANGRAQTPALLPIGHGSYAAASKLIAILNSNSSPTKRLIHEAKKAKVLKDATHGRHTRSVLIMENGDIILSALNPDTMAQRFQDPQKP